MNVKLSEIVQDKKGKVPSSFSEQAQQGYVPYVDIDYFDRGILNRYARIDKKVIIVDKNDVLLVWDGSRFGLSAIGYEGVLGSTLVALKSNSLFPKYLYYFLVFNFNNIHFKARGTGTPHVDPLVFWNLEIPVPPLAEQQKIVNKIEELFGVIDEQAKKLEAAQAALLQYRQSVLNQIFNTISQKTPLKSIFKTSSGRTPSRRNLEFYQGNIPWVKSGELNYNTIIDTEEHLSQTALDNSAAKLFPKGSLLIALYGATIGKLAFLGVPAATNQAVCCIFPNNQYDMQFLYYFLQHKHTYLISQGKGGEQKNISQEILKELAIPTIDSAEQKAIVKKIETAFACADKAQKAIAAALEQAKQLKQGILRRAFEGRLVK